MMNSLNKKSAIISAQLTQLLTAGKTALFVSLVIAIILAYMIRLVIEPVTVLSWLTIVLLIGAVRIVMLSNFNSIPTEDYSINQSRLQKFRIGVLLSGLVWGSAGFILFPAHNVQYQMFLIFTLIAVSSGIVVSYTADRVSSTGFSLLVIFPLVARLLIAGDRFSLAMGTFGLLYMGYVFISVSLTNKRMHENFNLQFDVTQHEKDVTKSAELNKTILQTAMQGFLLVDKAGRLLQVNNAYCLKTGYSEQELLTMGIEDLCSLESPDELAEHFKMIVENGEDHFESRHSRKDGSTFPVEVSVQYKSIDGGIFVIFVHDITRRKQFEFVQKEEQNRLHKIASRVPGVVYEFLLRPDGSSCFPYASEAINQIYRVSPEEVREDASKVFAIIHPDDYDDIVTSIQMSAKDLTQWYEEYRVKFEDGKVFWLLGNAVPEREENGDVLWHGFITDITKHKEIEQELIDSEFRWKFVIEGSGDGVWDWNIQTDEAVYSNRWKEMLGYTEDDILPTNDEWVTRIHPDDQVYVAATMQAYLDGKIDIYVVEYRLKCKDESYKWILGRGVVVSYSEDGKPLRMIGTHTDITGRKLTELELRIAAIAFESQESIMITDVNKKIVRVNSAFVKMTGYSSEEIVGQSPRILSSGLHDPAFYNSMWKSINTTDTWNGELWNRHKNGEIYPEHLTITAVRDSNGSIINYVGTAEDITERKKIEQELVDSEYRWKFAIEGSGDGVWDVNVQTQEANYSKRWKGMLGFAEDEELTSRHEWISRIHTDDQERVLKLGQAYLNGEADSYVVEYRLKCKDDSYKWMLSRGMIVSHSEDGRPLRMIGTQTDITERKNIELTLQQTKSALEESHEKFKDLYEFAPIGYLTLSSQGLITQLNWRASAMLGMDRKSIIHKRITQFIDESEKARWSRMFLSMKELATEEELSFDLKFTLHNGMTFVANLNCARMSDDDEQSMLRITLEDVTMVKKSESDLRVAATAFESHDGLMITDSDNKILRVNKAFSAITGYSEQEVIGKSPRFLASGRHDATFFASMWESLNKTGRWTGEIWNRRKDGDVYPENLTITAVNGDKGILTNYVATFTDISTMKAAADEIQQLAFFDSLTHLPNRRLLLDRLKHALATGARSGRQGAVLFLDLDHFKVLNDSLGHDVGDLLLQQVATRLTACVREGDTVARLGGDEYVVVLEDLSEQDLEAAAQTETIANKILDTLNQPYKLGEHEHHITPSIGIAVFKNHHVSVEELLKQADIAMYQAKKAGRNTLRFFNPQMQISITARVALERELRKAIDSQQLHLFYQIQVDNLGHPLGAEALIRWIHPERGLVSPAQFIPLAEETGLILPIGHWVLDTACAQIKAWHKNAQTRDLTLSINVSARQFRQPDFVAQVRAAIERHSIDPMQLKIELTESLLLENIEDTIVSMIALGEIGVQFSLDDFGTGYSSLQYLKRLPLFQLKIDQSFVRDIVTDSHDRSIVRTIIAMAQSLYLNVIAEGVETEQQRELLLSNGCKRYQGYLFGKPLPIDQFNTALKQGIASISSSQLEHY